MYDILKPSVFRKIWRRGVLNSFLMRSLMALIRLWW